MASEGPFDEWKYGLLQRFRVDFELFVPAYTTGISLRDDHQEFGMGIFSSKDDRNLLHLSSLVERLEERTQFSVTVESALNGLPNYVPDFEPPQAFSLDDYIDDATIDHWKSQKALGLQTIFQMKLGEDIEFDDFSKQLTRAFKMSIYVMPFERIEDAKFEILNELGDGCLACAIWPGGSAVIMWDGEDDVHVNFFTSSPERSLHMHFLENLTIEMPALVPVVHDEQPRGIGRIVSFPEDLTRRPVWAYQN